MGKFAGYLKETDLFQNLTQDQLELIEQICEDQVYQPGETIFHESAHENELYLIVQGQVDILLNPNLVAGSLNGAAEPTVVERFWPGQSFGEMALVDQGMRSGTAIARDERTHLLRISRQALLDLCEAHPQLGYRVMYNLAVDLSQKVRSTGLKIREAIIHGTHDAGQDARE